MTDDQSAPWPLPRASEGLVRRGPVFLPDVLSVRDESRVEDRLAAAIAVAEYFEWKYSQLNPYPLNMDHVPDWLARAELRRLTQGRERS